MSFRIGQGYDVHRLIEGRPLVLGGEVIPFDRGLDGFSDADVLLHALGDALLGAAGLGDLGSHFPPGDAKWKDADSCDLLREILFQVGDAGYRVVNCDLTLIAEAPKLAPYSSSIRRRLADLLETGSRRRGTQGDDQREVGLDWSRRRDGGHGCRPAEGKVAE